MSTAVETLWAVGSYENERGDRAPWRISHGEIGRDIGAATARLTELGVAGRRVLWCSMLSQAGQYWPYICGTVMAGARLSCADASYGEAMRVSMFLRLMEYDAVLGVTDALLDGLDDSGHAPADVFGGVRILGAHPGAYERLIAAGLAPVRVALCGPALAIGREPDGPAFVLADEWQLDAAPDDPARVCVTALGGRAQEFSHMPTAICGQLVRGGVVPTAPVTLPSNKE